LLDADRLGRTEAARQPGEARLRFRGFETGFSFDRYLAFPARASRTGRTRYRLVGTLFGEPVVVAIVSPLGFEAVSIVSLRIANVKERAAYDRA
jgi:uncharacterized protein